MASSAAWRLHSSPSSSFSRIGIPTSPNPLRTILSATTQCPIRRRLWEEHAYDENLPGLEDLEWAKWAFEQGYRIAYLAEAEIIHVHSESWQGIHKRYMREGMAFKQIYPHASFSLGIFGACS
jgi:GT2 family glycosyltransferase